MGASASKTEIAEFRERVVAEPRKYIAQHRIELSSCPMWWLTSGGWSRAGSICGLSR